jgi:hypothetical protein
VTPSAGKLVGGLFALLALSACGKESVEKMGNVAVRLASGYAISSTQLVLGSDKFELKKDGSSNYVRTSVGATELQFEREGRSVSFSPPCKFEVKKTRLVIVTVTPSGKDLKCAIQR